MIIAMYDLDLESTLAIEEAFKLRGENPKHELLRLLVDPENDETWNRFQKRFGKKGVSKKERCTASVQAYFWHRYRLALEEANKKIVCAEETPK